jgi:hypothetical protein
VQQGPIARQDAHFGRLVHGGSVNFSLYCVSFIARQGVGARHAYQEQILMSVEEIDNYHCAAPSAPSSIDLIAAADDEADESILDHLRSCPACSARVAQIRLFQHRLRQRLYRLHCPSSNLLIDHCQGLLNPYQRAALAHHLALCPHCSAELALLERSMRQLDHTDYTQPRWPPPTTL